MTTPDLVTCQILEEILSFRRQGFVFTYKLLGLTHMDLDDVFDGVRVELRGSDWSGIDFSDGSMSLISDAREKTI